jgi:hypothetical protein
MPVVHVALLRRLSPPADFRFVVRRLDEIQKRLGQNLFREIAENQTTKVTRRQLEALRDDLKALKTRAWRSVDRAFQDVLREDPTATALFPKDHVVPSGMYGCHIIIKTVERALADLEERKRGARGRLGEAGRQAVRELVELYCEIHGAPAPSWDVFNDDVRNPEALDFALQCLSTWKRCDVSGLTPRDIIRSL